MDDKKKPPTEEKLKEWAELLAWFYDQPLEFQEALNKHLEQYEHLFKK